MLYTNLCKFNWFLLFSNFKNVISLGIRGCHTAFAMYNSTTILVAKRNTNETTLYLVLVLFDASILAASRRRLYRWYLRVFIFIDAGIVAGTSLSRLTIIMLIFMLVFIFLHYFLFLALFYCNHHEDDDQYTGKRRYDPVPDSCCFDHSFDIFP